MVTGGPGSAQRALSGRSLVGAGYEPAQVTQDVPEAKQTKVELKLRRTELADEPRFQALVRAIAFD